MSKQVELLRSRRFMPLFGAQLLGAFNDNLFKSAFVMLATYGPSMSGRYDASVVGAMAGAALIFPYFLFSATAGELADRFERSRLLQILKAAEGLTVIAAAAALLTDSLILSMAALTALGMQATFSSPVRYALLPQHLAPDELLDGNALLEGGTFLAILVGTIAGSIAVAWERGPEIAGLVLVMCGIGGFVASLLVPPAPPPAPGLRLRWNIFAGTAEVMRQARERRAVWLSIAGISWFWLVGAVYLSQLPAFAKTTLGAASPVVTLFLAAFSIGVGFGSSLCGRLMHGEISPRYVPLAGFVMAALSIDLALASGGSQALAAAPLGIIEFLSRWTGLRIFLDLLGVAVAGGFFVVPLYAIVQSRSEEAARARAIAANNVANALMITAAAIVTSLMIAFGRTIPDVFAVLAVLTAAVAVAAYRRAPDNAVRRIGRRLFGKTANPRIR